jgi:hypothetical protein
MDISFFSHIAPTHTRNSLQAPHACRRTRFTCACIDFGKRSMMLRALLNGRVASNRRPASHCDARRGESFLLSSNRLDSAHKRLNPGDCSRTNRAVAKWEIRSAIGL